MSRPLRALLLAAGLGTRLRPLTLNTPKCLVQIGGEPLLGRWLHKLEKAGAEAVLVNTHYMADQVTAYLQSWKSQTMTVQEVHETKLLGTAGTLMANQEFFKGATGLLIHADNVMLGDLRPFLQAHQDRGSNCLVTMLTFSTKEPEKCGIVEIDRRKIVQQFYEKAIKPPGNVANGAIYAFERELLKEMKAMEPTPSDFSTETIPKLVGRIQTWHTYDAYIDIGTPEALQRAQDLHENNEPN